MTNFKLAAIAALAITAVIDSQVQAGAYDSPYAPTYSSYPADSGYPVSSCPSGRCSGGQCGSVYGAPSSSRATYSYSAYAPAASSGSNSDYSKGNCPNGSCGTGSCRGGCCGAGGCCANGRCGTCPPGACQSGNCSANCPNGQCRANRKRDRSLTYRDDDAGPAYGRADYASSSPRYTPASWTSRSSNRRDYDSRPADRYGRDRQRESPFYE